MGNETKRNTRGGLELPPLPETSNAYDMLIAELEGRRERLNRLLQMLTIEANRHTRSGAALSERARCKRAATRIS